MGALRTGLLSSIDSVDVKSSDCFYLTPSLLTVKDCFSKIKAKRLIQTTIRADRSLYHDDAQWYRRRRRPSWAKFFLCFFFTIIVIKETSRSSKATVLAANWRQDTTPAHHHQTSTFRASRCQVTSGNGKSGHW